MMPVAWNPAALLVAALLIAADVFLGLAYGWLLAAVVLLALAGWAAALAFRAIYSRRERQAQAGREEAGRALAALEQEREEDLRRMQALRTLSRDLISAGDEHALMDHALATITRLAGALGCSFVPIDEWEQPLPAFTHGKLPEPVLRAWSAHLAGRMLQDRCASCQALRSSPGGCPLHPEQVGEALTVHCLPLELNRPARGARYDEPALAAQDAPRSIGVLHLYMPAGRELEHNLRGFLMGLLPDIAAAYENARLRSQEETTLRQLQVLHAPESDFALSLGGLLEGLRQAIEADCVVLRLRPSADERLSGLTVRRGGRTRLDEEDFQSMFDQVIRGQQVSSPPGSLPVWLALPLFPPQQSGASTSGTPIGILVAAVDRPHMFHPRQQVILQTVSAQAALLVENERMIRSLEYRVVIQERTRLAREIHDGLAQTLAFLKLQAAQMQSYLAQGDLARLSQVLKENYQALTEAYLDTRQSIDNLRLTPQEGLAAWLERSLDEFETVTGLVVERHLEPLDRRVSPEVQAQLIRVVQEALSNVRKHARAGRVWISLRLWEHMLLLEIRDDGQGFDAEDVPEISRHGLRGMRERAEMIGADFQITSQPRQGTSLSLSLPLPLEEETR